MAEGDGSAEGSPDVCKTGNGAGCTEMRRSVSPSAPGQS